MFPSLFALAYSLKFFTLVSFAVLNVYQICLFDLFCSIGLTAIYVCELVLILAQLSLIAQAPARIEFAAHGLQDHYSEH